MQHEFGPAEEYPSGMARRLAGYGYSADKINAALLNSYGRTVEPEKIGKLVRKQEKRVNLARMNAPQALDGIMKADDAYAKDMAIRNTVFVARLMAARAA